AANNTIGGSTSAARNVISGNSFNGVRINGVTTSGNLVQGNYIGTGIDGARPLGNRQGGIYFLNSASSNSIGGTAAGQANIIAFNSLAGLFVETGNQNQILSNSIFSNDGLGIDLSPLGVTANDATDADAGPNNLQNFPVLTLASSGPGGMNVQGSLTSTPSTSFTIQFFSSSGCDPAGHGEGRTFLGSANVTTGAGGVAAINLVLATVPALGEAVTATATDPQGNTSEFSACIPFGRADLAVTKTASSPVIEAGGDFSYEITVRNNGPDTALNVRVTDNLPAELSFVSCGTTGGGICAGTGNNRTVTFSSLAAGADARITIAARLVCTVANGAVIANSATASSPLGDPVAGNNTGQVSVTASNSPATIAPSSFAFARDGGEAFVSVTAPPCLWTAQSNDPWITFPFGSSGIGTGGIIVSVAPNSTGGARTGTATIAGRTLTINQSNQACSFSIAPQGGSFTHEGGNGQINVTAPAGCRWKALSDSSWIILNADTATGSGAATFTVEANTGAARTGAITIEGLTFTVTQDQAPCNFALSPASDFISIAGDDGSIEITTRADCAWTARASDSWIEIDSANSGVGSGMITYRVRDNATGAPRLGNISIGNAAFIIVQDSTANLDCSFTVSPQEDRFPAAGGSGSFSLRTDDRCAWRAVSSVNWITVTSVEVGIGRATITYLVKPNSTAARRGEIQIGSVVFAVKQKGG
ncbi:MAG TPA: BACON domain-containing carbohydrate-binding protein, partial [Blastocatellia bacterium]